MSSDLTELYERVDVCADEIADLSAEVGKFFNSNVYIRAKFVGLEQHVQILVDKPVPVKFRSRSGMIVNELRACLDALACVLAERNGQTAKNVYFPVSKSKDVFESDGLQKIKKLSDEDKKNIASLNPYFGGNDPLFKLHTLDLQRKHQKLAISSTAVENVGDWANRSSSRLLHK